MVTWLLIKFVNCLYPTTVQGNETRVGMPVAQIILVSLLRLRSRISTDFLDFICVLTQNFYETNDILVIVM